MYKFVYIQENLATNRQQGILFTKSIILSQMFAEKYGRKELVQRNKNDTVISLTLYKSDSTAHLFLCPLIYLHLFS